jgi:hydrogenase 3 maturation protease
VNEKLVLTVGNEMMGDDAAGPLLARKLRHAPVGDWGLLNGGNAPENHIFKIREMAPERVLIVDAAEMDLPAGTARLIDKAEIGGLFLLTTHSMPLNYLMESLGEFVPCVEMIGIQPEVVAFGWPVSAAVLEAVERVYRWLGTDGDNRGAAIL